MSDTVAAGAVHAVHAHHEELGFWRTYVFSTDHKMIGRQFLFLGLTMLVVGGLLAMMVRWQLGWPDQPIVSPLNLVIPHSPQGTIGAELYNASFTMHATIMIFFAVMPI